MAGLYIHVPFCGHRCAYCDFYSTVGPGRIEDFLEAVKREMTGRRNFFARSFVSRSPLSTIYVGGGTPSLLSPAQLRGLLDHAAGLWECSGVREVTLEANPEDLTDEYLAGLARTGFNRLSVGIQSFDDGLLGLMNRRHTAARAREAVRAAQDKGFDNISIDLIWGIPSMTPAQWEHSLEVALDLGVQHISAYHLTVEPGTAFGKMAAAGKLVYTSEAESERQFEMLREKLGRAGFEHYEISNFALPGRRAIHNSAYWSGEPYLGVGPSAHSYDGVRRREWVCSDLGEYLAGPTYGGETLTDRELANERLMTGLRTADGLASDFFSGGRTSQDRKIERFMRDGLLVRRGNRITIPPEKFLLSDYVISELFL